MTTNFDKLNDTTFRDLFRAMSGHIEYVNGFPVWVDGETNWKISFTSVSLGIAEDLPYYPSTTTTPIEDFNMKDKNEHNILATYNIKN